MVIISDYEQTVNSKGEICIKSNEQSTCPICNGTLGVIGSRCRGVSGTDGDGGKEIYRIRRLRCMEDTCRKIHHELPNIIVPYKRHSAQSIEKAGVGDTDGLCMEISTVYRLKRFYDSIKQHYHNTVPGIKEKYKDIEFSACPKLCEVVRTLVNENLWVHTRSAFCPT